MYYQKKTFIRNIIHINIVNFYIAVAQALNPKLRSYPVAVSTAGKNRRILIDVSACAHEFSIYRGMSVDAAKRRCPELIILNPSPDAYRRAGNAIITEAARFSPYVETAGPGHVFIDLTGTQRLFGKAIDVADKLRKEVKHQFNLENSIGLASNKLVSKIATRVIKPAGLCSVNRGCEESFMSPLPIRLLPGIDTKVIQQLYQFNFRNIKDIHSITQQSLASAIGPVAFEVYRFSKGIDDFPVKRLKEPEPSVEESITLKEQTNNDTNIRSALLKIVIRTGMRLRKMGFAAHSLRFIGTYSDGSQCSRSIALHTPLNGDLSLFEQFSNLYTAVYLRRIRLSSIAIVLTELTYPYGQLDLFADTEKESKIMTALDSIRDKFGEKAVRFWGMPGVKPKKP